MPDDQQALTVPEVTVAEAAGLLGVSGRTVLRLIEHGQLRYRSAGLPTSQRPRYRVPLSDVLEYRASYSVRQSPQRPSDHHADTAADDDLRLLGLM